jgi:hypothetical protein
MTLYKLALAGRLVRYEDGTEPHYSTVECAVSAADDWIVHEGHVPPVDVKVVDVGNGEGLNTPSLAYQEVR